MLKICFQVILFVYAGTSYGAGILQFVQNCLFGSCCPTPVTESVYDDYLESRSARSINWSTEEEKELPLIQRMQTKSIRLDVMSLNMKYDDIDHFRAVANLLGDYRPDIILLQEMHTRDGLSSVQIMAETLGYKYYSQVSRPPDYEGLGILSKFRHSISEFTQAEAIRPLYYKTKDKYNRMALITDFDVPKFGKIRVANTHLAHRRASGDYRKKQITEALRELTHIQSIEPASLEILGGDFNSNKYENFYKNEFDFVGKKFRDGGKFIDLNGSQSTSHDNRRIDFLFYKLDKEMKITEHKEDILFGSKDPVSGLVISDHKGVLHRMLISY